jgi:coatomer subunit beta
LKDLKQQLQTGNDTVKIEAMKAILTLMLQGELLNSLLMDVIRFVMPSKNKQLKKLCVLYWECCQKRLPDSSPIPEMVLVCNALRNDLLSPNEFVRGQCLRFLCKLKEVELLEPLVPSVRVCLVLENSCSNTNIFMFVKMLFWPSIRFLPCFLR